MKTRLLIICFAALCLSAAPAKADLFGFSVHDPRTTYDGTSAFNVLWGSNTELTLSRAVTPTDTVHLYSTPPTPGNFTISMTIDSMDMSTADGVGSFIMTDIETPADTITGEIRGIWFNMWGSNVFVGKLSNVLFNDNGINKDGNFDADDDFVSMVFTGSPQPWSGTIIELTAMAPWFGIPGDSSFDVEGGSVDATVVPVPAAVILGILGLGVVGWKLRKYA